MGITRLSLYICCWLLIASGCGLPSAQLPHGQLFDPAYLPQKQSDEMARPTFLDRWGPYVSGPFDNRHGYSEGPAPLHTPTARFHPVPTRSVFAPREVEVFEYEQVPPSVEELLPKPEEPSIPESHPDDDQPVSEAHDEVA